MVRGAAGRAGAGTESGWCAERRAEPGEPWVGVVRWAPGRAGAGGGLASCAGRGQSGDGLRCAGRQAGGNTRALAVAARWRVRWFCALCPASGQALGSLVWRRVGRGRGLSGASWPRAGRGVGLWLCGGEVAGWPARRGRVLGGAFGCGCAPEGPGLGGAPWPRVGRGVGLRACGGVARGGGAWGGGRTGRERPPEGRRPVRV